VFATVKTLQLEDSRNTYRYANAYNILAIKNSISYDAIIVAEERLDHTMNTRIPFYLNNYLEFAAICPANAQVANGLNRQVAFLMDSYIPDGSPKANLHLKILEHCGIFMDTVVRGAPVEKLWPQIKDITAPPAAVHAEYKNDCIEVRWTHSAPEKIKYYNIYWRTNAQIFYLAANDFYAALDAKSVSITGNEAKIRVKLREPIWIIVTAVDTNNNESGFDRAVQVGP
jgi:hypothetical protein